MSYSVDVSASIQKELIKLKKQNKFLFDKIMILLEEIERSPKEGKGMPERLKHSEKMDVWSRRINKKDRFVYRIIKEEMRIEVLGIMGHYLDH